MADFIIYTIPICPYCIRAKDLLARNNFSFEEITFDERDSEESVRKLEDLFKKTNGTKTFPQIFDIRNNNEMHIGGYTNLQKKFDGGEIYANKK